MTFHSPWAFLVLAVVLVAAIFYWWIVRKQRATFSHPRTSRLRKVSVTLKQQLVELPFILKASALCFAVVALARPQLADEKVKRNVEGIDIMIVLDISDSMLIEDMRPENRLEAAKATAIEFVNARVSDRIGLVVFSGESFTRVPLTLDYDLLRESISRIEISRNVKMGTAIGVALANAAARLKDSTAKSRVILFLTDGENNSGTIDPLTALDIVKGYGLKTYTIGIGKDGETQLPIITTDQFGRQFKRYQPFYSAVNQELLEKIATETGGRFYRAETANELSAIYGEIDRLERNKIEENKFVKYEELFPSYLWWALLLYFMGVILPQTWLRRSP